MALRPIAAAERDSGSSIVVKDLEVGLRLDRFLLEELWKSLQQDPQGEVASVLYEAGLASRDPDVGHGYVRLSNWRTHFEVPQTDWAVHDRWAVDHTAPEPEQWDVPFYFSEKGREAVRQLCRRAALEKLRAKSLELKAATLEARQAGCSLVDIVGEVQRVLDELENTRHWLQTVAETAS